MTKPNWDNQTIWTGDNLDVMRGMNSESADLIYLDPPFNSNANYAAPVGSQAAGAAFKDTWGLSDIDMADHRMIKHKRPGMFNFIQATREIHSDSMMSYLLYMAPRLIEMHRILKPTGTIYLHCNQVASHYLKIQMDYIFGAKNFASEIIWRSSTPSGYRAAGKKPIKVSDTLLSYAKEYGSHTYNPQYTPYSKEYLKRFKKDSSGRLCRSQDRGKSEHDRIQYLDESPGVPIGSVWEDIPSVSSQHGKNSEKTGFPTQKPLALLKRIIEASSNPGDVVFDPFAGCATTLVQSELSGRNWIGIDISPRAAEVIETQFERLVPLFTGDLIHRTLGKDRMTRKDIGTLPKYNCKENRAHLYELQDKKCAGCFLEMNERQLRPVDHIYPRSKGGTDELRNLQLLCTSCNSSKGSGSMANLLVKNEAKGVIARAQDGGWRNIEE